MTTIPTLAAIRLRYLNIDPALVLNTLLLPTESARTIAAHAVGRLGIPTPGDVTPADAWLTAMHHENNLPDSRPAHNRIVDALLDNPEAYRFYFAIV